MSWYTKYTVNLDPPKRCSKCSVNLTSFLSEDRDNIKSMLLTQPNKLQILKKFLKMARNKELLYKILNEEVKRVLT